jgi:hypothetical protein
MFVSLLHGRTLITKEYNSNFTGGDVITVTFFFLMDVIGICIIAPNIFVLKMEFFVKWKI